MASLDVFQWLSHPCKVVKHLSISFSTHPIYVIPCQVANITLYLYLMQIRITRSMNSGYGAQQVLLQYINWEGFICLMLLLFQLTGTCWLAFRDGFAVNPNECLMTRIQKMTLDYHFKVEQEAGSSTFAFFGFNGITDKSLNKNWPFATL